MGIGTIGAPGTFYFMCHLMHYASKKNRSAGPFKSRQELGHKLSLLDGANLHP